MFLSLDLVRSLSLALSLALSLFLIVRAVVVTLITQHVIAVAVSVAIVAVVAVVVIGSMQIYPLVHVPISGCLMQRNNFFLHFPLAAAAVD